MEPEEINDPEFTPETTTDKDGKETTEAHKQITVDKIYQQYRLLLGLKAASRFRRMKIMNNFYRELYPMQFEESLFHIHLNVDYPFNLTGILFFPKLSL